MSDLVVAMTRRQLRAKRTDFDAASTLPVPAASPVEIAEDERRLGFPLPRLMKRLYMEIGNGGFGPGYGLIGLTNGAKDDLGRTAPEVYLQSRSADPDDPQWCWPIGLLPICHWGCAILSCIDCSDSNFRMRIFDPNARRGSDWTDSFFEEPHVFESWISDWARGANLWEQMYGDAGRITRIVQARSR